MQQLINDPAGFAAAGWHFLWAFLAHVDGRIALGAGAGFWFLVERLTGGIYDPLKRGAAVVAILAVAAAAALGWGGYRAASGPAPSFESLWKTPNVEDYQRVK
jgi:hypothetical protein